MAQAKLHNGELLTDSGSNGLTTEDACCCEYESACSTDADCGSGNICCNTRCRGVTNCWEIIGPSSVAAGASVYFTIKAHGYVPDDNQTATVTLSDDTPSGPGWTPVNITDEAWFSGNNSRVSSTTVTLSQACYGPDEKLSACSEVRVNTGVTYGGGVVCDGQFKIEIAGTGVSKTVTLTDREFDADCHQALVTASPSLVYENPSGTSQTNVVTITIYDTGGNSSCGLPQYYYKITPSDARISHVGTIFTGPFSSSWTTNHTVNSTKNVNGRKTYTVTLYAQNPDYSGNCQTPQVVSTATFDITENPEPECPCENIVINIAKTKLTEGDTTTVTITGNNTYTGPLAVTLYADVQPPITIGFTDVITPGSDASISPNAVSNLPSGSFSRQFTLSATSDSDIENTEHGVVRAWCENSADCTIVEAPFTIVDNTSLGECGVINDGRFNGWKTSDWTVNFKNDSNNDVVLSHGWASKANPAWQEGKGCVCGCFTSNAACQAGNCTSSAAFSSVSWTTGPGAEWTLPANTTGSFKLTVSRGVATPVDAQQNYNIAVPETYTPPAGYYQDCHRGIGVRTGRTKDCCVSGVPACDN